MSSIFVIVYIIFVTECVVLCADYKLFAVVRVRNMGFISVEFVLSADSAFI